MGWFLAQSSDFTEINYDDYYTVEPSSGFSATTMLFFLALVVVYIVSLWQLFTKAGEKGWKSLIPIYNTLIWLKIVGKPWWWILLFLIPFVNIVFAIIVTHETSKSFGHSVGMTLLLLLLPFIGYPYLAFGSSKYLGPGGKTAHHSA